MAFVQRCDGMSPPCDELATVIVGFEIQMRCRQTSENTRQGRSDLVHFELDAARDELEGRRLNAGGDQCAPKLWAR